MTESKYFFYPKSDTPTPKSSRRGDERALPSEHSAEIAPPHFAFRAGHTLLSRPVVQSAEAMASTILSDLASLGSRMASKKLAVPFSSLFGLLSLFCEDFSTVTVHKAVSRDASVATCTHNLLFAIGTVVHHAAANALPLDVIGGEDASGPMILLQTGASSLTAEEAAEHFGLSPYRLAVLQRITVASDFSFEIIPADHSRICFHIPRYAPDTYRVFALTDPTLRAAFMQPPQYFIF